MSWDLVKELLSAVRYELAHGAAHSLMARESPTSRV